MEAIDFLKLITAEPVRIPLPEGFEEVILFRLGTFDKKILELAGLDIGTYLPHIHDQVTSIIHVVQGSGWAQIGNEPMIRYMPEEIIRVPAGVSHGFEVEEPSLFFTILDGHILDPVTNVIDFRFKNGHAH